LSWSEASAISGSPGSWTAEVAEGWDIFGISNGGYLMALATRAMEAESDGRALVSATAHYLNPVSPGAVSIEVATLKQGRTMSTMRARMSRGDRQLLTVTSVFADPERSSFERDLVLGVPPDLPSPEDCTEVIPAESAPFPPPFTGKVDLRMHPADAVALLGEKSGEPVVRGWFRLRDEEAIDSHAVVLATDAMPPAIFNSNLPVGWTPTIDLSVQVRNPAPRGWLACKFTTRFVTSGLLEEDGEIWDESGRPVALSRQLALVPR
jgi:acyl-CoA thioesterase